MNPMPGRFAVVLVLLLVAVPLTTVSCLTTKNFKDPDGPRYEGSYAPRAPGEEAPTPARPFRVVTFNIAFAKHIDAAIRLFQNNDVLRAPDVLLLQEMDSSGVERSPGRSRSTTSTSRARSTRWPHREFGTAILSPWPLREDRKSRFRTPPSARGWCDP